MLNLAVNLLPTSRHANRTMMLLAPFRLQRTATNDHGTHVGRFVFVTLKWRGSGNPRGWGHSRVHDPRQTRRDSAAETRRKIQLENFMRNSMLLALLACASLAACNSQNAPQQQQAAPVQPGEQSFSVDVQVTFGLK